MMMRFKNQVRLQKSFLTPVMLLSSLLLCTLSVSSEEQFNIKDWFNSSTATAVELSGNGQHVLWVNSRDGIQIIVQSLNDDQHVQINLMPGQQLQDVAFYEGKNLVYLLQVEQEMQLIKYDLEKQKQQLLYKGSGIGRLAQNPSGNFPIWFLLDETLMQFDPFDGMVKQKIAAPKQTKRVLNSVFSGPCVAVTGDGNVFVRHSEQWTPLTQPRPIRKILPDSHCEKLWALSEGDHNTISVHQISYDEKLSAWETELVARHKEFDIDDFVLNEEQTQLAAYFYDDVYPQMENGIRQYSSLWSLVRQVDPHAYARVIDSASGDGRFLIEVQSPTLVPTTYLADLRQRELIKLSSHSDLTQTNWIKTDAIKVKSTNESELIVYLTATKRSIEEAMKQPIIVKLHGGPFEVRDRWRFDPEAQWLAQLGFDVLTINYQGSGGFGESFQTPVFGKLRDTLEDDIDNVFDYLEAGLGYQRSNACLMGASFGGFAALSELIENNESYKCGILISSVTDLAGIYSSLKTEQQKQQFVRQFGNAEDKAWQSDNNLVEQAEALAKPVLVIYSESDPLVPSEQSKQLVARLEQLKKSHQVLRLTEQSHSLADGKSRTEIYQVIEQFLLSITNQKSKPGK